MRVEKVKEQLLRRRSEILDRRENQETSWKKLQEPEVEFEEEALKRKMSRKS